MSSAGPGQRITYYTFCSAKNLCTGRVMSFATFVWALWRNCLARLVADAGQRLLAPQHGHDVEDRRRDGAAGEGGAQGLCNFAELLARSPRRRRAPRPPAPGPFQSVAASSCGSSLARVARASASSSLAALSSSASGRCGGEVGCAVDQVEQGLGPLLQRGQRGREPVPAGLLEPGGDLGAVVEVGQQVPEAPDELGRRWPGGCSGC